MIILALDPGTTETGWVVYDTERGRPLAHGFDDNEALRKALKQGVFENVDLLASEKVEGYGIVVGQETLETVYWSGRFDEAWDGPIARIGRKAVKSHLCGTTTARDAHVNEAIRDRFGVTKKKPGILKAFNNHELSALGVALTYADNN